MFYNRAIGGNEKNPENNEREKDKTIPITLAMPRPNPNVAQVKDMIVEAIERPHSLSKFGIWHNITCITP